MIKELELINWKSFKKSTLHIDPLTFLIGTNASGKSNILDAFIFLHRIANGKTVPIAINGETESSPIRGGLDWIVRKGEAECTLNVLIGTETSGVDYKYSISLRKLSSDQTCEIREEKLNVISHNRDKQLFYTGTEISGSPVIPTHFYTAKPGRHKRLDMNRSLCTLFQIENQNVQKEIKSASTYVLNKLKSIFILDPIPNHMRGFSKLSDSLASDASNIAGVLAALDQGHKELVESELTKYLKPLPEKDITKVWAEKVGRFGSDAMLYCEENWTNKNPVEIDARSMSDGTLRFLAIVAALLTGKENSLLIVEEIDNGLHPSRSKELVKVLNELGKKKSIDILCTTHNPALIDALGNTMLPFISFVKRDDKDGTSNILLLEEKSNLAKLMAGNSIGDLMTKGEI